MKLFKITPNHLKSDWDVYIGAIVVANDAEDAKTIHPNGGPFVEWDGTGRRNWGWVDKLSEIDVDEIGEANPNMERGVVLDSYCAG